MDHSHLQTLNYLIYFFKLCLPQRGKLFLQPAFAGLAAQKTKGKRRGRKILWQQGPNSEEGECLVPGQLLTSPGQRPAHPCPPKLHQQGPEPQEGRMGEAKKRMRAGV